MNSNSIVIAMSLTRVAPMKYSVDTTFAANDDLPAEELIHAQDLFMGLRAIIDMDTEYILKMGQIYRMGTVDAMEKIEAFLANHADEMVDDEEEGLNG